MGIGIKTNRYSPEKAILTKLTSDATATQSNIDNGKTAYVNGAKITGTSTKVNTSGATATAADIASGKTAWVNGEEVTGQGTMDPWTVVTTKSITGGTGTIYLNYQSRSNYLKIKDRSGYVTIIPIYSIPGGGMTISLQGVSSSGSSATISCTLTYQSSSSRINISITGNHLNAFSAIQELSLA